MKFPQIKETANFRLIALFACLLLILSRDFYLILNPRLWAEEGSVFLSFAYKSSITAIFTTVHVGYITFFNSIISFIQAKLFAIDYAPVISTLFGLLVQLMPIAIIIFSSYFLWDTVIKKTLSLLVVVFITPPELFLNTTNSHFIFGLCCLLIALISTSELGTFKKWSYRLALFLGVFTGPSSMLLTPMFMIRAYNEKQKERYIQTAIMITGSVIQASIILYSILFNNNYKRLEVFHISTAIQGFIVDNFSLRIDAFGINDSKNIGILLFVYIVYLFIKKYKEKDIALIFAGFLIVAIFSTAGSLRMEGSPRYAFIPSFMLYLVIISEFFIPKNELSKFRRTLAYFVFILAMSINILSYHNKMRSIHSENFPQWKPELAKWKIDHNYKIKIHPQNSLVWEMELKK